MQRCTTPVERPAPTQQDDTGQDAVQGEGLKRIPTNVFCGVRPIVSTNRCATDPTKEGKTTEAKPFLPHHTANKQKIRRCPSATKEMAASIPTKLMAVEDPPPCDGSVHDGSARMNPSDKRSVRLFTCRLGQRSCLQQHQTSHWTVHQPGLWHQCHQCPRSKWTLLLTRVYPKKSA